MGRVGAEVGSRFKWNPDKSLVEVQKGKLGGSVQGAGFQNGVAEGVSKQEGVVEQGPGIINLAKATE